MKGNTLKDDTAKAGEVDAVITPQVIKGIYRLEGDSLTYCLSAPGKPRPKRFEVQKGSGQTLVVLTRQKTKKAKTRQSSGDETQVRLRNKP